MNLSDRIVPGSRPEKGFNGVCADTFQIIVRDFKIPISPTIISAERSM